MASKNENSVNEGFQFQKRIERTKWETFRRTLYNSETNQILGRTGKSWGNIFLNFRKGFFNYNINYF